MFTFKNKIKIIIVLIFFFNIGLYAADNEANLEISGFKIYTEEPMVYFYNGETEVIAPDIEIVNEILKSFNSSDKIEILSWDAAYKKTLEETNAILFSTALNEERKNLFKWAGPIGSVDNSFFALKKSDIKIKDADDLKKIKSIGVLKDYFNEQQLKKAAFQNLVYVENDYDAIKKLFNKEIDLYASNSYAFPVFMKILSKNLSEIEKVFTLSTSLLY
nr:ABC transporter substrate-binding protein [bacterium]